jgi:choice-of-anchor C domain-containing protein
LVVLGLTLFLAGQAGAVSAFQNGNFADGIYADPGNNFETLYANSATSTAITGWTVVDNSVDWIGSTYWQGPPPDGGRSLDMDGTPGAGGIAQTFATTPGTTYQVTFELSGNPYTGEPQRDPYPTKTLGIEVVAGDHYAPFTFDVSDTNMQAMGWVKESWVFTATDSATTLTFQSLDIPNYEYCGPVLGNVAVSAVSSVIPEPITFLTGLMVVSGIGAYVRRRTRIAKA